jgi:acyl-CoA dehydrogenase
MLRELSQEIRYSEEQALLGDTAATFFIDRSPIPAVRAAINSRDGFDAAIWTAMVELGWTGIAVPEALGGGGLGLAEAVTIAEPMGRSLCAAPFVSTQLFVQGLLHGGTERQRSEWLTRVVDGAVATVAVFEPDGAWDLTNPVTQAVRAGRKLALHGSKTLATDAAVADQLLVSVRCDGAPALVVVAREELPDGAVQRESVIDETQRSYRVSLDGIEVPVERLIEGDAAVRALRGVGDAALLLLSALATGGTAAVLALTVEYLNTRTAFGRKIGTYQALKHPCAEMLIALERARSHLYHAATLVADDRASGREPGHAAEIALRMTKVQASDAFAFAADRAIQFHGAIGFTYECDAQLFLRRALWLQYSYGDAAHHRKQLADRLFGGATPQ